jgi:hypothetical protein
MNNVLKGRGGEERVTERQIWSKYIMYIHVWESHNETFCTAHIC